MSDNPDIQWALDLLKSDPNYDPGVLKTYSPELGCMLAGAACGFVRNWYGRRPFQAGVPVYIASIAIGYVVSQGLKKIVDTKYAERDTRLRNYIVLHPELFPPPERVKYADVLLEWIPVR